MASNIPCLFLQAMRTANKISAFLLVPIMLLSFTGASLHLHICRHTGKIYADVNFDPSPSTQAKTCCHESDAQTSCCSGSCKIENNLNQDSCCVDLQKEINTDKDYSPSYNTSKISPADLDITEFRSFGWTAHALNAVSFPPDFRIAWFPPPCQSRTVLIL